MMRLTFRFILLMAVFTILISACSSQKSSGAAQAIENYLSAVVSRNTDQASALACKEYEETAQMEVDSFAAVTPRLEGVSCQESGKDGDVTLVKCKGNIIATYNNEDQKLELEPRTFKVVQQDGEWRMCGYK